MHLSDIRGPEGPYWAAYQEERARSGILDNPAHVPDWFVAKLARERVAAARVGVERCVRPLGAEPGMDREVWEALKVVEAFIREGHTLEPAVAQVVAGLLGAQEVETRRDRVDAGQLPADSRPAYLRERERRERIKLAVWHLTESGVTTTEQLTARHAAEAATASDRRDIEWAALAEIQAGQA